MNTTSLDIDFIKQMYVKFKDTNEENIKIHVVTKFLEMLGYNPIEFYYEHSKFHKDGRADIAVKIDEVTYLYVEVKSSDNKLNDKEQSQLAQYLYDRGLSWGILTNGKNFILFNSSINVLPNPNRPLMIDKVVFNIDIFNKKHKELTKFFRKESIFDNQITNYFKDIAQYKAFKYPDGGSSWGIYKGTLLNFFKYYANQQQRYRKLEEIRVDEFEDFLIHEKVVKSQQNNGKKINSLETFDNKYSHIRSFFQTLKVKNSGFDEEKNKLISKMDGIEKNNEIHDILNEENISLILHFYDTKKDSIRNKTIFLLCLCFGLERSTLLDLTIDSFEKNKLLIGERELVLPPKIIEILEELKEENKLKKIKGKHIFYTKYKNQYKPISTGVINYIFDNLQELDKDNPSWSGLSSSSIRLYLIKQLFKNNYSLEEIVYMTGADLLSINNIISYSQIIEKVKTRDKRSIKIHPFHKFLY